MIWTGDVNMEKGKCMKCGENPDNLLPMCSKCRVEMKDFPTLANFLNSFEGNRDDTVWLIKSEIADRQSLIISGSKVVHNVEDGTIEIMPPDGHPALKQKAEEIRKLYKAMAILKKHYKIE